MRRGNFGGSTGRWCILRTSGGKTMPLAKSLAAVGLEVWTPIEMVTRRKSRTRKIAEFEAPILPTFVFARAVHLAELIQLRQEPGNQHPAFSIFHGPNGIPVIADSEIAGLRTLEDKARERAARAKAKAHAPTFGRNDRVRVASEQSAWTGMTGIVEGTKGKNAMVRFGIGRAVKIATYLLVADLIQDAQPGGSGTAAIAA